MISFHFFIFQLLYYLSHMLYCIWYVNYYYKVYYYLISKKKNGGGRDNYDLTWWFFHLCLAFERSTAMCFLLFSGAWPIQRTMASKTISSCLTFSSSWAIISSRCPRESSRNSSDTCSTSSKWCRTLKALLDEEALSRRRKHSVNMQEPMQFSGHKFASRNWQQASNRSEIKTDQQLLRAPAHSLQ